MEKGTKSNLHLSCSDKSVRIIQSLTKSLALAADNLLNSTVINAIGNKQQAEPPVSGGKGHALHRIYPQRVVVKPPQQKAERQQCKQVNRRLEYPPDYPQTRGTH